MSKSADTINQLPKGWKWVKLEETGKIVSGGTPSTALPEYWNGNINWISPADLTGYKSKTIIKGAKSITESGLKKSSARLLPKGSVLFSSRAPIGYVVIAGNELCTNQGFKSIIPNQNVDSEFLYYFLKGAKRKAEEVASGTTFKEISLSKFAELLIPLPPKPTQLAIVSKIEELFSELDKGIENLRLAQQQLKTYRQSVLKWAFEGKLTNENAKDGELPKGWKWVKMGEAAYNFDGSRVPLSRMVRAKRKGIYRYYGATEIVDYINDFIFDGQYLLIGEDGANLLSKAKPLAFIVDGKFWVNNHAHVLQAKSNCLNSYLCYYFNSLNLAQFVTGTAQPKLTQGNLNKIEIPICSIEEQSKIVLEIESRLSVADKMEESISQSLQQAEALRQSILKKAFEGRLV